jgi:decaprenyl-phosphate phosphoribosyltransferase
MSSAGPPETASASVVTEQTATTGLLPASFLRLQLRALPRACRPRQWSKNLLVAAAPAAAGILTKPDVAGKIVLAFVSFCMISSATYLLNDIHDRAEDRADPRKRNRPIASGELSVPFALASAVVLMIGGLATAVAVSPALAAVALGYVALTGGYTLWLRSVPVADIAAVAGCFVMRALAGGAATSVNVSRWFLLVTSFGALFVVAGKRYAELQSGEQTLPTRADSEQALASRATLEAYSAQYLRFVVGLAATVTTSAYCLWAFQRPHHDKLSWYELTIVPFVLWLLRYALILDQGDGHAPEEIVLRDRFLLSMSAVWLIVFVFGVYVAG